MRLFTCIATIVTIVCLIPVGLHAQVKVITAHPDKISPGIEEVHSANIALYNPTAHPQHKLILMIQGTGGSAAGMRSIDSIFATFGFNVISIDYKNNVISTVCLHSKDSACADKFRNEIITGDPVSNVVEVDSNNSILNRFRTFLAYLSKTDLKGGWDNFIHHGEPVWNNIIVAGHSQGAGHAAYLGKLFPLDRVLIFSGPQDYLEDLHMPAPWLSMYSSTPPDKYFAFLNLHDPFKITNQLSNCEKIMQLQEPDTLTIHPGIPIQGHHQILITTESHDPHSSTIFPQYRNVWAYMLGITYFPDEKKN